MTSSFKKVTLKFVYTTVIFSVLSVPAYAARDEVGVPPETAFTEWTEPAWIMDDEAEPSEVLLEWKFRNGERPVYVERQTTTINTSGKVKKGAHSVRVEYHITDEGDGLARVNASWKELAAKGSAVEFLQFIKRSSPNAASFTVAPDGKYMDVKGVLPFRSLPSFPDMPVSIGSKWEGPISVDYAPGVSGLLATGTVSYLLAGLADIGDSKWANITFEGEVAFSKRGVPLRQGLGIKRGRMATEAGKGVIISGISEGRPADKAGLKESDIIFKYGDRNVNSWQDLRFAVSVSPPEEPVKLVILRDGVSKKVTITPEATLSAYIKSRGNIKGVLVFDVTEGVLLRLVVSRFYLRSSITEGEKTVEQVLKIKSLSDLARHPRASFPAKIGDEDDGATAFAFSSSDSGKKRDKSAFTEKIPSAGAASAANRHIVADDELEEMAEAIIDEEGVIGAEGLIDIDDVEVEKKIVTMAPLKVKKPPPVPVKPVVSLPEASLPVAAATSVATTLSKDRSDKESFPLHFISVASFKEKGKALDKMDLFEEEGYSVKTVTADVRGEEWHRVLVGPFHSVDEAKEASLMIEEELELKGTWILTERKTIKKAAKKAATPPAKRAVEASVSTAPHLLSLPPAATSLREGYAVAIGSFLDKAKARELADRLRGEGYEIYLTSEVVSGVDWQRVVSGPYNNLQDAKATVSKISEKYKKLTPWVLNVGRASSGKDVKEDAVTVAEKPSTKKIPPARKAVTASGKYMISLASFTSKVAAERLVGSLNKAGYDAFISETITTGDEPWHRVAVGFYSGKSEAELFLKIISRRFSVEGASVRKASPEVIERHQR